MLQTAKSRCCLVYFDGFYSQRKYSGNWPPDLNISRSWTGIGVVRTISHHFWGCTWPLQSLKTSKNYLGSVSDFFVNGTKPSLRPKSQIRDSKAPGISRVKRFIDDGFKIMDGYKLDFENWVPVYEFNLLPWTKFKFGNAFYCMDIEIYIHSLCLCVCWNWIAPSH